MADVEFIASSFGGGWAIANTDEARAKLRYLSGEDATELLPLGGKLGWIIEPQDMPSIVEHFSDAGYRVEVDA